MSSELAVAPAPERAPDAAPLLVVEDLHAEVEGHEILRGVDLVVGHGELHAVMGPNGSGKSTLANVLLGKPGYAVTQGRVLYRGDDVTAVKPDERAKAGMFLAFQYPEEIPGVPIAQFLRQAIGARRGSEISVMEVRVQLREWLDRLGMDRSFASRHLNEGFSGGEKKRVEILQMAMLDPELAILDETDSGLDIDGVRVVSRGVDEVRSRHPDLGVVVVTHYRRILDELKPDVIHVLIGGRIVATGGPELAARLDREGYDSWRS
ncbi:MAG: Fe-S cluster assembly ATPase SufC [Acidimicrobiales bacterium]